MALITINYTFSAGATIIASQHNANNNTIVNAINGGLDNANIASNAGIVYSKLVLTGNILNGDLSASLNLPDSKLAGISTAGKVDGAALINLNNTPTATHFPVAALGTGTPSSSNYLRGDGAWMVVPNTGSILVSNTTVNGVDSGDIAIDATKYYMVAMNINSFSDGDTLAIRLNNDSTAAHYQYTAKGYDLATGAAISANSASATYILMSATTWVFKADAIFFILPQLSGRYHLLKGSIWGDGNITLTMSEFFGVRQVGGSATTSFRIISPAGKTLGGNILVYELKQS
jgi:hypothetical protein